MNKNIEEKLKELRRRYEKEPTERSILAVQGKLLKLALEERNKNVNKQNSN
jgi:hypothetical protein